MAVAIFILSSIPGDRLPGIEFNLADKIAHFIIFGVLGFLLARSLSVSSIDLLRESYVLWSTLIGIIYGLFDELHQYFIPGRYTSLSDWIADGVGVVFFVVVYRFWKNMKSR
jgi:VanZ family protein